MTQPVVGVSPTSDVAVLAHTPDCRCQIVRRGVGMIGGEMIVTGIEEVEEWYCVPSCPVHRSTHSEMIGQYRFCPTCGEPL